MLADLLSLVYPKTCLNCGTSLISVEKIICTTCKVDLPETKDHEHPENTLFQKFAYEPSIRGAYAFLYFSKGGIAQKLIHSLKYLGRRDVGEYLGYLYGSFLSEVCEPDIIIPVPLHRSRERRRGFNQSLCFATGLASGFPESIIREDLVHRATNTATQTEQSKTSRWGNVQGIYTKIEVDIADQKVLIVDDVITTGATIGMLSEAVKNAGVTEIYLACIARGQ